MSKIFVSTRLINNHIFPFDYFINLYHVISSWHLKQMQKWFGGVQQDWQNGLQLNLNIMNDEDDKEEIDLNLKQ